MKNLVIALLVSITKNSFSQDLTKTMLRFPDTGQTMSYTNTNGEDNDYTINTTFFKQFEWHNYRYNYSIDVATNRWWRNDN